jgi:hypothetical protein
MVCKENKISRCLLTAADFSIKTHGKLPELEA